MHQGIDIFATKGTPIRSVTAGRVYAASKTFLDGYGGYGMVVVILTTDLSGSSHYFLYAHCDDVFVRKDDVVSERQIIATVGTTYFLKKGSNARFSDREAHLHFEVSTVAYPPVPKRSLGEPFHGRGRVDPYTVLEELGPWSMTKVHLPTGEEVTRTAADELHARLDADPSGGYFPLGINNSWHGGVHLPVPLGTDLVAPFDATIVAARLDPDPATSLHHDGHTNFLLLRHELSGPAYALFQGESPDDVLTVPSGPSAPRGPSVGRKARCTNPPAHVVTVKQRLHAHHDPRGRPYYDPVDPVELENGTSVPKALDAAIRAFQVDVVGKARPDGIVDIPGDTWTALHDGLPPDDPTGGDMPEPPAASDPRRILYCLLMHLQPLALTKALAARFPWVGELDPAHRTPARGDDGMAKVLTGLDVKVRSGEALWASGQARGFAGDGSTLMLDQVHWELFSEHLLPAEWEPPLHDPTDDLTLDVPRHVIGRLEHGGPVVDEDGQLQPHEVREIYRTGRARFLRRTPCRFVDQWALDLDQAIARLDALGYASAGLREQLAPFMWWPRAAGVLPPSRFVWHYDPIELLADYSTYLAELSPDPATHPTLEVRVAYDNRMPMLDVPVQVRREGELVRLRRTDAHGIARFRGLAVGDYEVRTPVSGLPSVAVALMGGRTTTVDFATELPGPPPPRGSMRVIVRNHRGTREPRVPVMLVSNVDGVIAHRPTHDDGEVRFADLRYDDYTLTAGDSDPLEITLDAAEETVKLTLQPPPGTLHIAVTIDGVAAPRQRVKLTKGTTTIATELTDEDRGIATFELREGRYRAGVGKRREVVRVVGFRETTFTLPLSSAHAPEPEPVEGGRLEAWVHRGGEDEPNEWVYVLDGGGTVLDHQPTDRDGMAVFELPVGEVLVAAEDASVMATVSAVEPTRVSLALAE